MESTAIYVKNMVCDRCKLAVAKVLRDVGLTPTDIRLGVVTVAGRLGESEIRRLRPALRALGFDLLEDRQKQTVERIRSAVIELVHYRDGKSDVNLSEYLSSSLGIDYSVLSKLFSESEGMTIERYFILQKIERVKELLFYGEMSLGEIAFKMNYSSTAHLSAQFKSVTGMTPTQFKATGRKELTQLDRVGT